MMFELRLAETAPYSTGDARRAPAPPLQNLGNAIFLAAIEDYRSIDEQTHRDAERFLYPKTQEWQDQYDWVMALATGLNPAWVRDALDRFKGKWNRQRYSRRVSRMNFEAKRRLDEIKKCS